MSTVSGINLISTKCAGGHIESVSVLLTEVVDVTQ